MQHKTQPWRHIPSLPLSLRDLPRQLLLALVLVVQLKSESPSSLTRQTTHFYSLCLRTTGYCYRNTIQHRIRCCCCLVFSLLYPLRPFRVHMGCGCADALCLLCLVSGNFKSTPLFQNPTSKRFGDEGKGKASWLIGGILMGTPSCILLSPKSNLRL